MKKLTEVDSVSGIWDHNGTEVGLSDTWEDSSRRVKLGHSCAEGGDGTVSSACLSVL